MFEELYEPLPDRDLYFAKLGMETPAGPLDKDLLDRIIYAHQCTIPFENLDIYDRRMIPSLGIADVFDKVIRGKRGGCCFELNGIFYALLKETGFDVTPCVGRSLKNRGYVYPFTHRATIAEIDGERFFCDVGYGGPMPPCAVPLVDGLEIDSHGQRFRIKRGEGAWWNLYYLGRADALEAARAAGEPVREPEPVTAFLDERMQLTDYAVLMHFCATSPRSVFTQWRMVNRRTPDGNASITSDTFTRVGPSGKENVEIEDEEQFRAILREEFDIEIDW